MARFMVETKTKTARISRSKWLLPVLDLSVPAAGAGAVMNWWQDMVAQIFGLWPNEWLLQNVLLLPTWIPATIIFLVLFSAMLIVHVVRLNHRLKPKLIIGPPVAVHTPKGAQNPNSVTFKVRITNKSEENIDGCQVRLMEMVNKEGVHSVEEGRAFKRSLDNPTDILNLPHDTEFNIAPGGWEDVDLVQIDYRQPTPTIRMLYALQGIRDTKVVVWIPFDLCPHVMSIRASARNCAIPEEKTLTLILDADGRHLQLREN